MFGSLKDAWQNKWVPHPLSAYSFHSCASLLDQIFVSLLEIAQIYSTCATDSRACAHREMCVCLATITQEAPSRSLCASSTAIARDG